MRNQPTEQQKTTRENLLTKDNLSHVESTFTSLSHRIYTKLTTKIRKFTAKSIVYSSNNQRGFVCWEETNM